MPATTGKGFPYPLPTEPVAEGAQAIRNLAEFLDGGTVRRIATQTLAATAGTIDFSSIPQLYTHLLLLTNLRCDGAVTAAVCGLRFNGTATNSYVQQQIFAQGATVSGQETAALVNVMNVLSVPGTSAPAGAGEIGIVFIPNYRGTAFNKQCLALDARRHGTSAPYQGIMFAAGQYGASVAITQITIVPGAGSFIAGSHASLYGLA